MTRKTQPTHNHADRARHNAIREKFQKERPSLDELIASGDAEPPTSLGEYLSLVELIHELKRVRQEQGISLSRAAALAEIDKGALSRLENDLNINPTLSTLTRYANALGANLRWALTSPVDMKPKKAFKVTVGKPSRATAK